MNWNCKMKHVLAIGVAVALAQTAWGGVIATGGNATNDIGGYRIHTFTLSAGGNVEALVVGGGGGGGETIGGGGGRIAIYYTILGWNGTPQPDVPGTAVDGGAAGHEAGEPGTIFWRWVPRSGTVLSLR
jgi:hypothetical protein